MTTTPAQPTRYGFKNTEGHRLHISTVGFERDHVELAIIRVGDLDWCSLNIPAAEAPAVSLAILTAAGFVPRGNRADSDSVQESVDTAAGYLDDAVRLTDARAAAQADAALLDSEALSLARAWYDMPDGDWDDLNAITGLAQMRATRAAKHLRTQDEAAK